MTHLVLLLSNEAGLNMAGCGGTAAAAPPYPPGMAGCGGCAGVYRLGWNPPPKLDAADGGCPLERRLPAAGGRRDLTICIQKKRLVHAMHD